VRQREQRGRDREPSDFNSKGVGLAETILKFSHQQHLRIAIEYVDRASMEKPIEVRLEFFQIILRSRVMGTSYDPTTHLNRQATTAPFGPREASAAERLSSSRVIGTGIPGANSSFRRLHRKVRRIGGMTVRRSYEDSLMNPLRSRHDLQPVLFGVCCPPND
jgi:hypothetical protein